jgi:hypothetical protein
MADLDVRRSVYHCPCEECHRQPLGCSAQDHQAINQVMALMDERQRRLFAGLLAWRRGHGGILAVAQITGLSRTTIRRGIEELRRGVGPADGRIRAAGGGRKRLEKKTRRW